MLCENCGTKPIARGIKEIDCFICSKTKFIPVNYKNICNDCSDSLHLCQNCGANDHVKSKVNAYDYYMNEIISIARHSETKDDLIISKDINGNYWVVPSVVWKDKKILDNMTPTIDNNYVFGTSIELGKLYTHYKKGDEYEAQILARHVLTQSEYIIYQAKYGDKFIWARPLPMWGVMIPENDITEFGQKIRFKLKIIDEVKSMKQCITSKQLKELTPNQFRKLCTLIWRWVSFV